MQRRKLDIASKADTVKHNERRRRALSRLEHKISCQKEPTEKQLVELHSLRVRLGIIPAYEVANESLVDTFAKARAIPGNGWHAMEDPAAYLKQWRSDAP